MSWESEIYVGVKISFDREENSQESNTISFDISSKMTKIYDYCKLRPVAYFLWINGSTETVFWLQRLQSTFINKIEIIWIGEIGVSEKIKAAWYLRTWRIDSYWIWKYDISWTDQ